MNLVWKIVLGIALGIVIIRGGGPALLRLALPAAIIYFGYKFVQRLAAAKLQNLAAKMQDAVNQAQQQHQDYNNPNSSQPHQQTIEICATCGHQKSPGNYCKC